MGKEASSSQVPADVEPEWRWMATVLSLSTSRRKPPGISTRAASKIACSWVKRRVVCRTMGSAGVNGEPANDRGNETSDTFVGSDPMATSAVQTYSRMLSERTTSIVPIACSALVTCTPSTCNCASRAPRTSRTDLSSSEEWFVTSSAKAPGPAVAATLCASCRAESDKAEASRAEGRKTVASKTEVSQPSRRPLDIREDSRTRMCGMG